jgi:hypothetical protein
MTIPAKLPFVTGGAPQNHHLVMTSKEAGRFLRLSHRTLEDWRRTGRGPRFRLWGRMVRYHASDLQAFVDGPSFANTGEARAA